MTTVRIVVLSDTHGKHAELTVPDGDVLVHAGDLTTWGDLEEVSEFDDWLATLPHSVKIVVAGNHDFCFERTLREARERLGHAKYLEDERFEALGLTFYGSPWQPWFMDYAFNLRRQEQLRSKWDRIPEDTDVLITHSPPAGIMDKTSDGERVGCFELLWAVERIRPRLHLFGHIHESYGRLTREGTEYVNASQCKSFSTPLRPAIVCDLS